MVICILRMMEMMIRNLAKISGNGIRIRRRNSEFFVEKYKVWTKQASDSKVVNGFL